MVNVKQVDEWFLIGKKVLFNAVVPSEKYINLAKERGVDIEYTDTSYTMINYPGEYDLWNIRIKCFEGKKKLLNYLISFKSSRVGLIQSPGVLNESEIRDMDTWLYLDDKIANKINHMELEGEQVKLEIINSENV